MTRRKTTDGERIAAKWNQSDVFKILYLDEAAREIDRIIRRRMAEAWSEGWFARDNGGSGMFENPYRGRKKK